MNRAPNPAVNRTAHKLQLWYPSALARSGGRLPPRYSLKNSQWIISPHTTPLHSGTFWAMVIFLQSFLLASAPLLRPLSPVSVFSH